MTHSYTNIKWEDLKFIKNDISAAMELCLNGKPMHHLSSKEIRTICSRLEIKGYRNERKDAMIQLIIQQMNTRDTKTINVIPLQEKNTIVCQNNELVYHKQILSTNHNIQKPMREESIQADQLQGNIYDYTILDTKFNRDYISDNNSDSSYIMYFKQWEYIGHQLRQLRRILQDESNKENIQELKRDISMLQQMKITLDMLLQSFCKVWIDLSENN